MLCFYIHSSSFQQGEVSIGNTSDEYSVMQGKGIRQREGEHRSIVAARAVTYNDIIDTERIELISLYAGQKM